MASGSFLGGMKEEARVVQATQAQQLNWWGYGLELNNVSLLIRLNESSRNDRIAYVRLTVIVEGRISTCYCRGQNENIRKNFPQNTQEETHKVAKDQS